MTTISTTETHQIGAASLRAMLTAPGPWQTVAIFATGLLAGVTLMLATAAASAAFLRGPTSLADQRVVPQANARLLDGQQAAPQVNAPLLDEQKAVLQVTELPTAPAIRAADTAATLAGARATLRVGKADAPVQVVVFSDPRCPYCAQLVAGAEAALKRDAVPAGRVAITYRHYPVLGEASVLGSQALECAANQGKFELMHGLLYAGAGSYSDRAGLVTLAEGIKLDMLLFKACLDDPRTQAAVDADLAAGRALGVAGTPTLFINGVPQPGAVPWDTLKPMIDRMAAGGTR